MKRIRFRTILCNPQGEAHENTITVTAKNINTGSVRALRHTLRDLPQGWTFHSIEFWMVIS